MENELLNEIPLALKKAILALCLCPSITSAWPSESSFIFISLPGGLKFPWIRPSILYREKKTDH